MGNSGSTTQPPFDPTEPWCELPRLRKLTPSAVFELVDDLRLAGIPVRSPGAHRSGMFSGGKVDVTLSVPERLQAPATVIIASRFGVQDGYVGS